MTVKTKKELLGGKEHHARPVKNSWEGASVIGLLGENRCGEMKFEREEQLNQARKEGRRKSQ